MANGIPGITVGGALQLSNTAIIATVLGVAALGMFGANFMKNHNKNKWRHKRNMMSHPKVVENNVIRDVVSYATDVNMVARNLRPIGNFVRTMRPQMNELIKRFRRGEITQEEYTNEINGLYERVLMELNIPQNTIPKQITNTINAKIDRIADKIEQGKIPRNIKFRMWKNHPDLDALHKIARGRAKKSYLGGGSYLNDHSYLNYYSRGYM